ncbi:MULTISPECIES: pyridoxamine 5'-phosphate oxidase family protein [Streptomyces]|uniref:pyridoxamine 5'-phosphate oxidase family protein n=1 Tax=Streptomyces TaxID=1883 RepID=UPI00163CD45E|nr:MULTISPECIES: pyridoxamine 5'-phosphate oxidase family protein [Streptomyces]MBC2879492.1 pyridoxamine 5'-phosphate oxidase family protein [Streptomyces sp. TYQ1024]UBI35029.1 pyridoxamine 5'-phosphate oxidase family protein [Streptomyces mobaraensis]UKW27626.1 pyridoxamine 5'-phosphate oxidase family protein [Streptomyces sp. TYQ1024]UKW33374.1 pyridoxamine 5'-phosphate oxidase family protein [Streptomyces sp. TYQ1024]
MLPAMPHDAREQFLAAPHIGILGVTDPRDGDRAPLVVPVWYAYEPGGEVVVETGRETVKARLLRAAGRFSLCVQDERRPYRYVSVEGPVTAVEDPIDPAVREALAHRYLDPDEARDYLAATAAQLTDDVVFRMRPQRWRTADFAAFAADFAGASEDESAAAG